MAVRCRFLAGSAEEESRRAQAKQQLGGVWSSARNRRGFHGLAVGQGAASEMQARPPAHR